jgi:hypothetical protein
MLLELKDPTCVRSHARCPPLPALSRSARPARCGRWQRIQTNVGPRYTASTLCFAKAPGEIAVGFSSDADVPHLTVLTLGAAAKWSTVNPAEALSHRSNVCAGSSAAGRLVVVGGVAAGNALAEVWELPWEQPPVAFS